MASKARRIALLPLLLWISLKVTWNSLADRTFFDIFVPANANASGKNLTAFDETINKLWRDQVREYTAGNKTRDKALETFKQQVKDQLNIDSE
ncbi:hypothetical protein ACFSQ7_07035 [Paenibacillus rhizoplanae]